MSTRGDGRPIPVGLNPETLDYIKSARLDVPPRLELRAVGGCRVIREADLIRAFFRVRAGRRGG